MSTNEFSADHITTVTYQVLFTRRDYEAILEHKTIVVTEELTDTGFASWIIADFVARVSDGGWARPSEWDEHDEKTICDLNESGNVTRIKKNNQRYLQVNYQVIDTTRRKPKNDED